MKIAIVGTGFLAFTRARCWRRVHGAAVEVVVAGRNRDEAAYLASCFDIGRVASVDEAFADPTIDLVDLCVPNHAHRVLCERAAAAGKHVLCTKPLAAYCGQGLADDATGDAVASTDRATMLARAVEDADAMVDACRRAGRHLFYGENWCFAPSIVRADALGAAASGSIVEMRGWESHSGSHAAYARDWRLAGGGALLRLGAHPIGAMLWMKAREGLRLRGTPTRVVSVTAEVRAEDLAPESWGSCTLRFDDGSVAVAHGSDHMLGGMQSHLTVLATTHRLECSLSPVDMLRAYAPRDGAFGAEYIMEKVDGDAGWSTPMPDEDWTSGQQGLVQSVADALARGEPPACDGALGAEVVRVVYAAYRSAAEGRRIELEAREGRNTPARIGLRATVLNGACGIAAPNAALPAVFREARRLIEDAADGSVAARDAAHEAACALLEPHLRCVFFVEDCGRAAEAFLGIRDAEVHATEVRIRRVEFDGDDDVPVVCAQAAFLFAAPWAYSMEEVAAFESRHGHLDRGVRLHWALSSDDPAWSAEFLSNDGLSLEYFGPFVGG